MVVVDEVLHADQEHVYSSRPFHREVLGIVPGKMEMDINIRARMWLYRTTVIHIRDRNKLKINNR